MTSIGMFFLLCLGCLIVACSFRFKEMKLKAELAARRHDSASREILERLERAETRLANLETLMLDQQKLHEFERRL